MVNPIAEKHRLTCIDAARGFAIFGIFMVNVPAFHAPFFLYGGEEVFWSTPVDQTIQIIIDVFFQASFYSLFSFLFGFGIQIIIENISKRNQPVITLLFRRLLILIGFGCIHAFLIWHGDILLTYGLIGMFLFLFLNKNSQTLLRWAFSLLLIPTLLYTFLLFVVRDQLSGYSMVRIEQAITNYSSGSLLTIWQQNFIDWTASNGVFSYILLTCNLLPLFLFGMVTARKRWLHEVEHHKVLIQKIWFVSMIIFIVVKAGVYFWDNHTWLSMFQDTIGGSASAIFYLTSITLLFQKSPFTRLLKPFIYVGKMSLSNYIFQSVACFILFYGVGFGLYNTINPVGSLMIVLIIYLCQVLLSSWYMTYYRFGPIEWVWRRLMYMEKLPNKRQPK